MTSGIPVLEGLPAPPAFHWHDAETEALLPQIASETWSAEETIRWGFTRFGARAAIVSAFGPEGMVIIDITARVCVNFRLVTMDTGFLFPETLALMEKVERRYHVRVERVHPALTPQEQALRHGDALWAREPDRCCELRKVEPLRRKLRELHAWFTGIRRDQTPARRNARAIEWDAKFGLWKLNPLVDWNETQVWDYIRRNDVPYNALHDHNYASIGCTHCTRPIQIGQDPRAGRWAGFAKTECGLHGKG